MANYHTEFSFMVTLPSAEQAHAAMELLGSWQETAEKYDFDPSEQSIEDILEETEGVSEDEINLLHEISDFGLRPGGVSASLEGVSSIQLTSECDSGDLDGSIAFVEILFARFGLEEPVCFEWAQTCDKLRVDAFGGGAVVISKTGTHWMNTGNWVSQVLQNAKKNLPLDRPFLANGVQTFLDASTAHLTQKDRTILAVFVENSEKLLVRVIPHEYGWFVHVPQDDFEVTLETVLTEGLSPSFVEILRYAASQHCWWINFDQDADTVEGLAVFEED